MTNKPTTRGKALAERLNKETILEMMPKIYFVETYNGEYRVGRTDWACDVFEIVPKDKFDEFIAFYKVKMGMPLLDLTHDDDGSEWKKVRTS